jgi:ATP-dependent DNA helicase DinG
LTSSQSVTTDEFIRNFPFPFKRDKQIGVLNDICSAFNSGYRYIILEAPTGFGKSPVAIAVALALGSSYICTSTKDLQTQYSNDFPYLRVAKGKNNFRCLVKDDFFKAGTYKCGVCGSEYINECSHASVEYGPCMSNESFIEDRCKYKTFLKDYRVNRKATKDEDVYIDNNCRSYYEKEYVQWLHLKNLKQKQRTWMPCQYFDQLNIALASSHSIFNYSNFLALLPYKRTLAPRQLLVLDEGHLLETEIVKFRGLSISKRRWKRYIQGNFNIIDYGFDDVEQWVDFLIDLESEILNFIGNDSMIQALDIERRVNYNWVKGKGTNKLNLKKKKKKIISASELFDSDQEIAEKYQNDMLARRSTTPNTSDEIIVEAIRDVEKLTRTINNILSDPKNWILSEIKKENHDVVKVELKPLDISPYCRPVLEKCSKTLIMSATILNNKTFCRNIGLVAEEVKFLQVESDFPIENRPIYPLNIAYLNFSSMQLHSIKQDIAKAVDNIMSLHKNDKGIIHTTSYEQLNFIKENISKENLRRLVLTDPDIQRDEVIAQHSNSKKPTVLISPSLHTGLDLRNELSRFQIITKIPYPNKGDRWTNAKREKDQEWYYWQTALKLIQACGRSIRSKDDWAKTYVLDSAFRYFVTRNMNILPSWFVQAIRTMSSSSTRH